MIILFNPHSTTRGKQPLPLSLMALAAVLEGREDWRLVDGNIVDDPAAELIALAERRAHERRSLLAVTVMPGPQLAQAVPVCKRVRAALPWLPIVWGGYFPTQHADTVLKADYVDFVVRSQGEMALLELITTLRSGGPLETIASLSWKDGRRIRHNPMREPTPLDDLPELPYHRVAMDDYLHADYLGNRTVAHHSSFGCPFACNFCAVVSMANRRWLAQSPARMERVLRHLVRTYGVDAVQMHDMDFFISEPRVAEFCERIAPVGLAWWGLGRVDTLMRYSDATWRGMARSGLKMFFSGAESGSDETLARMNKGGTASAHLALELARRMREYDIVPEYSFVIGCPPDPQADTERTFAFIREIKRANPATEVILYVYTPVGLDGTLYDEALRLGFRFPETLEEWNTGRWRQLAMRRGDGIPWIAPAVRRRVRNFERVLNAFYPTTTDRHLTPVRRAVLKAVSAWRYKLELYAAPLELRVLHRVMRYQRPETTGF
jgi:anaerobic magnesium-protoporphyrin IX monomethyl ester cyclase